MLRMCLYMYIKVIKAMRLKTSVFLVHCGPAVNILTHCTRFFVWTLKVKTDTDKDIAPMMEFDSLEQKSGVERILPSYNIGALLQWRQTILWPGPLLLNIKVNILGKFCTSWWNFLRHIPSDNVRNEEYHIKKNSWTSSKMKRRFLTIDYLKFNIY